MGARRAALGLHWGCTLYDFTQLGLHTLLLYLHAGRVAVVRGARGCSSGSCTVTALQNISEAQACCGINGSGKRPAALVFNGP